MADLDVSIIIPTYNERDNLPVLIERIDRAMSSAGYSYEVIVVDDSSPDGTSEVAKSLSKQYPVKVIIRGGKKGLSSAVLEGIKHSSSSNVVVMDADLQHPPEVIPLLLGKAMREGCEIVIATRYAKGGSVGEWNLARKLISRGATYIARVLLPRIRRVSDPMSGFFLLKRDLLKGVELDPKGFKILLELLARTDYSRVCEVPYTFGKRLKGESKLGTGEVVNYLIQVLSLSPHWVRFGIVGTVGSFVNLGTLALLRYVFLLPHIISTAISIEVSVINNFYMNDEWTFKRERRGKRYVRLLKFHLSSAAGVITQFITSNLVYYLNLVHESIVAQLIGILAGFVVNYLLSKWYVWRFE